MLSLDIFPDFLCTVLPDHPSFPIALMGDSNVVIPDITEFYWIEGPSGEVDYKIAFRVHHSNVETDSETFLFGPTNKITYGEFLGSH